MKRKPILVKFTSVNYEPASHENPEDAGAFKKVLFKKDVLPGGSVQMVNLAKIPVGKSFQGHYHEDMDEIFIITKGHASFWIDDEQFYLTDGDALLVPMRSAHRMKNTGTEVLEYLVIGVSLGKKGRTVITA